MSPLDNPVWNALSTIHASFAEGNELAKRYPVDVAPFAATRDQSSESYESLAQLLGPTGTAGLLFVGVPDFPAGWSLVRMLPVAQMVWSGPELPPVKHSIRDLNLSNIGEMLALVELTQPGPFSRRTSELGWYLGFTKQASLRLWLGNDSDSRDIQRSVLSAPVPKAGAADTQAPLSQLSSRRSEKEMRLPSFTSAPKKFKRYAYTKHWASIPDAS